MVTIKEVKTRRDLRAYVSFPNRMYKDCKQYIPPIYEDELADWDRAKNPAFEYCDAKCFLAYRDNKIVGRIGAILSHRANEKWKTNRMRFTQVDFIDDPEVSSALLGAVEGYAKECGCTEVHGPLGFCDLDREGMLIDGFDKRSMYITYYNYPYYNDHMARLGYVKDVDWVEHIISVPYDDEHINHVHRLAEYVSKRQKLHVATVKHRREYKNYVRTVFNLINAEYSGLYGTVELTERQIDKYCRKFTPVLNPKFVCFVLNEEDEMVGFGVAAPSLAEPLKRCNGHLFPFGFLGVLRALRVNDALDFYLVAVRHEYQGKGANALMIRHLMDGSRSMNMTHAETGPQLESNEKVQAQWKMFDSHINKRRRCYIKQL